MPKPIAEPLCAKHLRPRERTHADAHVHAHVSTLVDSIVRVDDRSRAHHSGAGSGTARIGQRGPLIPLVLGRYQKLLMLLLVPRQLLGLLVLLILLLPRGAVGDLGGQRRQVTQVVAFVGVAIVVSILVVFMGVLSRVGLRTPDLSCSSILNGLNGVQTPFLVEILCILLILLEKPLNATLYCKEKLAEIPGARLGCQAPTGPEICIVFNKILKKLKRTNVSKIWRKRSRIP